MAITNHERVGKALEMLRAGLPPFVERELKAAHGTKWWSTVKQITGVGMQVGGTEAAPEWDAGSVLKVLWECWNDVFGKTLGRADRSLTNELIEVRNKWAHQKTFSTDDAYRAIDSMQRLLNSVGAREQADELSAQSGELLRLKFDEQARHERRKTQATLGLDAPLAGLKPTRHFLAWRSICEEATQLNLDPFQTRQAVSQRANWDKTSASRIYETFQWLLAAMQSNAQNALEWQTSKVSGNDPLAVRAGKKLKNDGQLITLLHPTALKLELDKIPLWRGNHISVKQLIEDYASYLYLQRRRDPDVLVRAVQEGVASITWRTDTFAFAESYDEAAGRYLGLRGGRAVTISADAPGLLVKSEKASEQQAKEEPQPIPGGLSPTGGGSPTPGPGPSPGVPPPSGVPPSGGISKPNHFFGNVEVDATRITRDVDALAKEIIQHLASQPGAQVKVTVEIQATIPGGVSDATVRTVSENCRTLKFTSHGFEKE